MLYVGKATTKRLKELTIETIGDLANFDSNLIKQHLGKVGEMLFSYANGQDNACVRKYDERAEIKSVGNSMTYYKDIILKEVNINLSNNEYDKTKESIIILDLKKFNCLDALIQKKILLYAIKNIFGSTKGIEKIHFDDMIKLCNNNIGNKFLTPNKNFKIVIKNKQIILSSIK